MDLTDRAKMCNPELVGDKNAPTSFGSLKSLDSVMNWFCCTARFESARKVAGLINVVICNVQGTTAHGVQENADDSFRTVCCCSSLFVVVCALSNCVPFGI